MSQNNTGTLIPQMVITEVTTKLNEIITAINPYITPLSEEERKRLPKMSDKTVAFVTKAKDYLVTNPQFAPNFMEQDVLNNELANVNALNPLLQLAMQIANNLSDTIMSSGSDAYTTALQYYNFVKQADKNNVPGAKPVYDDLAQRFPSTRKNTPQLKVA